MGELRVIELLEGLCERVGDFALWTPSAAWAAANPEESAERRWVRIKGDGAHIAATQGAPRVCACPALTTALGFVPLC